MENAIVCMIFGLVLGYVAGVNVTTSKIPVRGKDGRFTKK